MLVIPSSASSRIFFFVFFLLFFHFRGEGLRRMHSSDRQLPAIRGQLGSLRHHVSEGVCQTQGGAVGEDQDLE